MKGDPLVRLFKNAALAKREEAASDLAFPAQARILAVWRSSRDEPDESEAFLPLLRKAILAAAAVSALAVAFTMISFRAAQPAEVDEMVAATNMFDDAIEFVWTE
jgi:hypothetical protein